MLEPALAFLAGLLIGSFLNVCIFRLPRDLSVAAPRSFCPGCAGAAEERGAPLDQALRESRLAWFDLIPVVNYILLGARCRRCGERIPLRYPLVELATAAAFAACVAQFGVSVVALKYAIFLAVMITLVATDFETQILPNEFTLGGAAAGLVVAVWAPMPLETGHLLLPRSLGPRGLSVGESLIGAAGAAGLIWFTGWLYQKLRHREGLGLGDVKMLATIGAFLGLSSALITLMFAAVLGTVMGLPPGFVAAVRKYRRIDRRRATRGLPASARAVGRASAATLICILTQRYAARHHLPFGSFLGVAAVAVAAYGELVLRWSRSGSGL